MRLASKLDISTVERETGLSKDLLRKWEERYGFPRPERDAQGTRSYTTEQVSKLRIIKQLLGRGRRPRKLAAYSLDELNELFAQLCRDKAPQDNESQHVIELLHKHDIVGLRQYLTHSLHRQGLRYFVETTLPLFNQSVGDAWMSGRLRIFEEHQYTETVQAVLRSAINLIPQQRHAPFVLLTTLSGEQHTLGLLMVEALLALEGAHSVCLGTQLPIDEIQRAALAHHSDIVALSFSSAYTQKAASKGIAQLRHLLPSSITLWVGGALAAQLNKLASLPVQLIIDIKDVLPALQTWQTTTADHTSKLN